MIKIIFCDLDGSLMNPSAGLYVSDEIKEKLILLQKKGIMVVLNSARTFQGVYPLAKQIHMDEYGGYCMSCNGSHVYDVINHTTVFEYTVDKEIIKDLWKQGLEKGLEAGFTQPEYCVCSHMSLGFDLDRDNCMVDYMVTYDPDKYLDGSIWKGCISASEEMMDQYFDEIKQSIESTYPIQATRSTPYMGDFVNNQSSKYISATRLLEMLHLTWDEASVIGDGTSDAQCIAAAKLGVTLENGNDACKKGANMIVPSCYEDGCIKWLDYLLEENA
ncbi:MAG: HAD family phosphatase [Holdemanella sp.]|nr:HAD family phosphatase [Holdemanella sp.]